MGRLTRDPELRYTPNNVPVCSFTLAVNRNYAKPGEQQQTDFINIVAWRSTAEFCSKYFTKGLQVVVCGRLQTRTWDDQEGRRHYVTEVVADETYFADSKRDNTTNKMDTGFDDFKSNDVEGFIPIEADDDLPF